MKRSSYTYLHTYLIGFFQFISASQTLAVIACKGLELANTTNAGSMVIRPVGTKRSSTASLICVKVTLAICMLARHDTSRRAVLVVVAVLGSTVDIGGPSYLDIVGEAAAAIVVEVVQLQIVSSCNGCYSSEKESSC